MEPYVFISSVSNVVELGALELYTLLESFSTNPDSAHEPHARYLIWLSKSLKARFIFLLIH